MTATSNRQRSREQIGELAGAYLQAQIDLHNRVQLWSSYGYDGWDTMGMRWGRREQDDIIQLRSEVAQEYWEVFLPLITNVSRLDLCATVQFEEHPISWVSDAYKAIQNVAQDLPIVRKYSIIQPLVGGDTLYVGSRQSAFFGRIYDKGMESGLNEFANCIRWEVEVKKPMAQQLASELAGQADKSAAISSFVHGWFSDRLVECPWTPDIGYSAIQFLRKRTSDDIALAWLKSQVSPTIQRLISRGKLAELEQSLSIQISVRKGV